MPCSCGNEASRTTVVGKVLFIRAPRGIFPSVNASAPILTNPHKVGLRVDDFLLLNASGAFDDFGKTELIDGDIYVMNARFSEHPGAKSRLATALTVRLREIESDLVLMTEDAIRLNNDSMPEPDDVVHRWRGKGPVPVESVALIVEVSDTTLATDLGRKSDLYAAAGIPEDWVIDLNEGRALMQEVRDADGYHGQLDILLTERLISATITDLEVEGAEVAG